jgi:hypothetical protein
MSLTQLKDQAAHLPFKEQRELIAFLVSLQTPTMTEREFDAELEKRGREIRQGKVRGEPVETVIGELREKYS